MADTGDVQSSNIWPLVKFSFKVTIPSLSETFDFQEVTGLSSETQVIEYRGGASKVYSVYKMPGIQKFGNVTLKKGTFKGDTNLWTWYEKIKMNTIAREVITISLLDEAASPVMTWDLSNAFPCKLTVTDMKSDANEVAVETMEIAFETLALKK